MFVLFVSAFSVAAGLSMMSNRSTAPDRVSASLNRAGRNLSSVEMGRQAHSIVPMR